ncbi:MAG: TrbC/VirB2 family protein [Candidatus Sulfotelmatobacter sp.]|jgi:type IV secretion system protein VirB2
MQRWFSVGLIRPIKQVPLAKSAVLAAALLALLLLMPVGALAQGSPFDTGFTAIQTLFSGTIAKVASLVAIVIGGYGFAHGEPDAKKALAGVAAGTGIAVYTNPADHSELMRERWTASVTYVFRDSVKNNELAVNPLGLTIVRFGADHAFS